MKFLPPLFLSCSLWGITDGQVWTGSIPRSDSNITLNSGDNFTVYLDRDPNVNQAQANDFGSSGSTNLTFSTSGTSLSSLTLRPKSGMSSTQFYHRQGNKISVNSNSHLTIDLQNRSNSDNRLYLFGGVIEVNQGGMMTITQLYRLSIGDNSGGAIKVNQGGKLEITQVAEVQNTRSKNSNELGIYNYGGELIIKTQNGVYNTKYDALTSSFNAGSIVQTSGSTLIAHNDESQDTLVYNSGFTTFNGATYGARHSLIEVQGGSFEVKGNIKNGGDSSRTGGAGVGWIVGRGNATINVRGWIKNTSEDNTLTSKIDLYNATLNVGNLENKQNGEIWLKDQASINATSSITSEANSKIYFIGKDNGFGKLTAQSLDLKGEEIFRVDTLIKNQDLKYLVATSPSTQGFNTGAITIQDINGYVSDRYTANLIQEGENTYIQLTPKDGVIIPPPLSSNAYSRSYSTHHTTNTTTYPNPIVRIHFQYPLHPNRT